jgi:diadenosine tetraphosphate (Ap4A) HIT family hydrolase
MKRNCPFCLKEEGEKLFSDDSVYACWDAHPVARGHALVVTHRHIESWFDTTAAERRAIDDALFRLKEMLDETHGPSGYNIGINVGKTAGQTIFHLHIHLIPRYRGDVKDPRGGVRGVIPDRKLYPSLDT